MKNPSMSNRVSLIFLVLVATVITMRFLPSGGDLRYIHYFPSGIIEPIAKFFGYTENVYEWISFFGGWVIYGIIWFSLIKVETRRSFQRGFIVFCVLLVLNVAGCQFYRP
ncbi:MAG: hypothetical protein ACJAVK_000679 [Akkermansiaceae bacterium]|jgi:hypothetical protein